MPSRKQGLRARAQRHAAVGDDGPAFRPSSIQGLTRFPRDLSVAHVEKENVAVKTMRGMALTFP